MKKDFQNMDIIKKQHKWWYMFNILIWKLIKLYPNIADKSKFNITTKYLLQILKIKKIDNLTILH